MAGLTRALAYEKGDKVYVVAPVRPLTPSQSEIEEYAFARAIFNDLAAKAPNDNIAWFGGQYVEAERPNLNGAMWLNDEIAVKALTPMFMPVTVMHDPRSAVGVIADARLHTPPDVPRNKIETALALWRHRFPEIVEEAEQNYRNGSLMQSMECWNTEYACSVCGTVYHKLPGGAEREQWCEHLVASNPPHPADYLTAEDRREVSTAVRILRNVVFTGTGLIFGTQGGTGADPEAHLESFFGEVAEYHERAHHATERQRSTSSMSETVAKSELDRVVAERDQAIKDRDEAREQAQKAREDLEAAETAKTAAEEAKAAAEKKVNDFEEKARKETLADERMNSLGKGFIAKLGEKTRGHLREDAASMSDEEWDRRLESVEEMAEVKRDDKGEDDPQNKGGGDPASNGEGTFKPEEIAAAGVGGAGANRPGGQGQSPAARRSVVSGLTRKPEKKD